MLSGPSFRSVSNTPGAFFIKNCLPLAAAGGIGVGAITLALLGMFRVEKDRASLKERIVLRAPSEALAFIQELTQLLSLFEQK